MKNSKEQQKKAKTLVPDLLTSQTDDDRNETKVNSRSSKERYVLRSPIFFFANIR